MAKKVEYLNNEETGYIKVSSKEEFNQFLEDGGWKNEDDFKKETGCDFEDIKKQWVCVCKGRVYDEFDEVL